MCTSPVVPSTMTASPESTKPMALLTSPTAAMPSAQTFTVIVQERRRSHRERHDDGVFRQMLAGGSVVVAEQLSQQTVCEVVEIVEAFAQIGVGLTQHAGPRVGLYALDRCLRGEAG